MRKVGVLAMVVVLGAARAGAQSQIALDEVVGSWLGDDQVQYVELRMLDSGQNNIANVAGLAFQDATGDVDGTRLFVFNQSVVNGAAGAKILVATAAARGLTGLEPEFVLPNGFLRPKAGRVCYAVASAQGFVPVDCVAYGKFTGSNGAFGRPTAITPDNRVLRRVEYSGRNRTDWIGALDPVLENNLGLQKALPPTLCGDGIISQGEECDGLALGGATCASLGFAKGKVRCVQCHYDVTRCTTCGNDEITGKEECDGTDLGERTCASIGYTGGALVCDDACRLDLAGCDPTFFVPGGGPPKTDCLAEWRIENPGGGPDKDGRVLVRQRCKDGTACDADATADGTCTFEVSACFSRQDARFSKCRAASVASWTLLGKGDPASPPASALLASVAALGPSTTAGATVTFAPPLAEANACGAVVAITVPAGQRLALRARTTAVDGRGPDTDTLRLVCAR